MCLESLKELCQYFLFGPLAALNIRMQARVKFILQVGQFQDTIPVEVDSFECSEDYLLPEWI